MVVMPQESKRILVALSRKFAIKFRGKLAIPVRNENIIKNDLTQKSMSDVFGERVTNVAIKLE
jgi:hypothetical protein